MKENFSDINTDLLVKYLTGEADASEDLLVKQWLAMEPSNRKYYDHLKLIWEQSKLFSPAPPVNEDAAWERFRLRMSSSGQQSLHRSPARFSWMRVAAMFISTVAATWLVYYLFFSPPVQQLAIQSKKAIYTDTLPDGSVVTLNRHSVIEYPKQFSAGTRVVSLAGEAFFDISPDKARPFIIKTNGFEVKVLGTSFNIKNHNGSTEIIVETGIVEVRKRRQSVRLRPREKLTVREGVSSLAKEPVTDKLYRYYRSKKFVCEGTPLYKLVETLNEAYDANITIQGKELSTLPLTTVFDNQPLENILAVISHTFSIKISRKGNQIILH